MVLSHIINEGYEAFSLITDREDRCPYSHMNRKRCAWMDGWYQAEKEIGKKISKICSIYAERCK